MICDSEANLVFISDRLEGGYPLLVDRLRGILGDHETVGILSQRVADDRRRKN
jgi:hypothetical protein